MQNITLSGVSLESRQVNEAYKILRTNITFSGPDVKTIVVTSCMPDEGKSEISFQLAKSLAESGKKVVYVDADIRKSVFLNRYHPDQVMRGLSHFLTGQDNVDNIFYRVENVKNLYLITAGPRVPNAAELLGGKQFDMLVQALRKVYDYIIIDSPPLGSVIDAALIAKRCDGALLVIEDNKTSRKVAKKVKEQLMLSKCPILGAVLNKVEVHKKGYYGKYYGNYE